MKLNNIFEEITNDLNRSSYLKWKKKNVSLRGVKNYGEENGGDSILGKGLYTAALSNKALSKKYGTVYYVVNALPKNPKVFDTLNDWQIWFGNVIVYEVSKKMGKTYPDKRDFFKVTTIEDELMKLGYDGVVIKGREYVNFTPPENVRYFKNEDDLINYYEINFE